VAATVKVRLVDAGHDVVWMGDLGPDPGDEEILNLAREQQRILVTLDKDFGKWPLCTADRTTAFCA
jgi:predicted nuclease of predicted toxin-antitoxin system